MLKNDAKVIGSIGKSSNKNGNVTKKHTPNSPIIPRLKNIGKEIIVLIASSFK
jgi:hypothetical protein